MPPTSFCGAADIPHLVKCGRANETHVTKRCITKMENKNFHSVNLSVCLSCMARYSLTYGVLPEARLYSQSLLRLNNEP